MNALRSVLSLIFYKLKNLSSKKLINFYLLPSLNLDSINIGK